MAAFLAKMAGLGHQGVFSQMWTDRFRRMVRPLQFRSPAQPFLFFTPLIIAACPGLVVASSWPRSHGGREVMERLDARCYRHCGLVWANSPKAKASGVMAKRPTYASGLGAGTDSARSGTASTGAAAGWTSGLQGSRQTAVPSLQVVWINAPGGSAGRWRIQEGRRPGIVILAQHEKAVWAVELAAGCTRWCCW